MDESLQAQIEAHLRRLDWLILRGRKLRDDLAADPSDHSALAAFRAWQQDCGMAINELSGGSKAHWLARSFSEAFLVRFTSGEVVETVAPTEIAERLVGVLERAVASLTQMGEGRVGIAVLESGSALRRFEFVHNADLRPILQQAYGESRRALEQSNYSLALVTTCGIIEAIVTDALEYRGVNQLADAGIPEEKIADWPFETRLSVAENARLIHGGWKRMPEAAKKYRELSDAEGNLKVEVSEGEARRAMQVLNVLMRDLDPGR